MIVPKKTKKTLQPKSKASKKKGKLSAKAAAAQERAEKKIKVNYKNGVKVPVTAKVDHLEFKTTQGHQASRQK